MYNMKKIKFIKRDSRVHTAPTAYDMAKIIADEKVIPVPIYSDADLRPLIVQPRGLIFSRKAKRKKKPIEL